MVDRQRLLIHLISALLCLAVAKAEWWCVPENSECWPSKEQFNELQTKLKGRLIFPYDMADYDEVTKMWNERFDKHPGVVVMVQSTADIQASILFARNYSLRVSVKSSGHDFLGRSNADGSLMINLFDINDIDINTTSSWRSDYGEIRLGTGNSWVSVYEKLNGTGRVVVGGSSPTVSPGGYTQGGGHSPLSKMYGLAVDNVLEMEAVLPDGRIAIITKDRTIIEELDGSKTIEDGDLFWALRGGGGGTFGIVPYYTYKLHPDAEGMVKLENSFALMVRDGEDLYFPGYDGLNHLNTIINSLPNEYSGYILIHNYEIPVPPEQSGLPNTIYVHGAVSLFIIKFGAWDNDTQRVYDDIKHLNQDERLHKAYNLSNFWHYQKGVPVEHGGRVYSQNSLLQDWSFSEKFTELIMDKFLHENVDGVPFACTHTLLGGAVGNAPEKSTPLHPGWRSARSSFSCGISVPEDDAQKQLFLSYGRRFGEELRKMGWGEYLNEPDYYNKDYKIDYWWDNYDSLLKIKKKYDPDNFLTCYHCVGNTMDDDTVTAAATRFTPTYVGLTVLMFTVRVLCFI